MLQDTDVNIKFVGQIGKETIIEGGNNKLLPHCCHLSGSVYQVGILYNSSTSSKLQATQFCSGIIELLLYVTKKTQLLSIQNVRKKYIKKFMIVEEYLLH